MLQIHPGARFLFDSRPDFPVDFRRGEVEVFVSSLGFDSKRGKLSSVEEFEDTVSDKFEIGVDPLDEGEVGHAKNSPQTLADLPEVRRFSEADKETAGEAFDLFRAESSHRGGKVSLEHLDEVGAIAFLQSHLVVTHQDRLHGGKITDL